jgi:hypothetical protein
MAIVSLINPTGITSVQDNLWHIAYSDNSGQIDFKYVYDVFVNGVQLVRTKIFPEPSNGRGYFDASQSVRNEITFDWFTPVASNNKQYLVEPNASGQISVNYDIRVGEDFSGVTTLNLASGTITAYNWMPPLYKRRQTTFTNQFLTNRTLATKNNLGSKLLIPIKNSGGTATMNLKTYDESNTLISNLTDTAKAMTNYYQLDIGSVAMNNTFGSVITSATKFYVVSFTNFITQKFIVNLDCNPRYTPINLYFINQYGMFDTARFSLVNKLSMSTERKSYQKRDYSFGNTSVDYYNSNQVYNESTINFGSKTNWNYKLTMDYINDQDYRWLAELIMSPQVYAEIDGSYYPVSITNNNYEYVQREYAGLKSLELDISLNQTRYGFRR